MWLNKQDPEQGQEDKSGSELLSAQRENLLAYLADRVASGAKPRSTARLLSSLRRFYQYMLREGRIEIDPSDSIDAPKLGRSLPNALTEDEI